MELYTINVGDTIYTVNRIDAEFYIMEGLVQLTTLTYEQDKWLSSVLTLSPSLTLKLGEAIDHYYASQTL